MVVEPAISDVFLSDKAVEDGVRDVGEMAELVRSFDWSATQCGPIEEWPRSLRTAVSIVLGSRFPMFVWWGQAMTNFYNDAYAPMLGKRHPSALGRSAFEVWADVWPICGPQAEAVLNEGKSTWNEELLLIVERNGFTEETYFTFSYSPVMDDAGSPAGVFCAVTEDTAAVLGRRRLKTLRDLGERALMEGLSDLQACHAAGKALSENPNDFPFALVYLLDSDGRHCHLAETINYARDGKATPSKITLEGESDIWNFRNVLQRNRSVLTEGLEHRFGFIPAGHWKDDYVRRALVLPLAKAGVQELPAGFLVAGLSPRLQFNDGYRGFLELAAGHIATAIANARAYQEERKRADALIELDRAKTTFFSNVSHEFRTPLALMLGPLEEVLSSEKESLRPEQREQLVTTYRNSLRLLKLVNTLLDFSRIEAGRVQANYEPVDLAAFTVELCAVFRAAVEKAGLRLEVDCPLLSKPIYVDRDMWEKIVLNLLSNAFKFTFEGQIAVQLRAYRGHAELKVRDTGTGIPEHEIQNVFKRFHRVEGARGRTYEGSGIGLAFIQELVKLHGGTITVASSLGKGTEFTVLIPFGKAHLPSERICRAASLPATTLKAEAFVEEALRWLPDGTVDDQHQEGQYAHSAALPARERHLNESSNRPCVLVADDNADMREYLHRLLASTYDVLSSADGESALAAARKYRPNLILTDAMMPRLDGIQLLQAIRSDQRLQTTPVIVLSARTGEESRLEGLAAGADDYLLKPFSARELVARVESHLKLARVRHEAFERERDLRDELEEQRRRAHEVIESITDGFIALDAEWRFTYVNKTAERLLGKSAAELIGRNHWQVYPATLGTIVDREYRRAYADQSSVEFENFYEPFQRWFDIKAYPSSHGLAIYFRDITDRKTAEAALRESEEQLAAELRGTTLLYELGNDCSATGKDFNECLLQMVDVAIALTGAEKGNLQIVDKSGALVIAAQRGFESEFLDHFSGVHEHAGAACAAAMKSRHRIIVQDVTASDIFAARGSLDVMLKAGARAVQSTPLISSAGNLLGMISTHYSQPHSPFHRELRMIDLLARQAADYLERRQVEEALRESEIRLRTMSESLPNLLWTSLPDGQCDWLSSQWCKYTGIPENDLLGLNWLNRVIHPQDRERTLASWTAACEDRANYDVEFRIRRHDGQHRWFKTRGVPIKDATGKIAYWFGTCTDIEEMKQAQLAIQRLAAIVEHSEDAILSLNLEGIIQSWNQGAVRMYGYAAEEILGRSVVMLIPEHRRQHESWLMEKSLSGYSLEHVETQRRRKDGSLFDVALTVSPIKNPNGNIVGISKIARDITDKVRAKEKLEQAVAERTESLRKAIAQMEEFSYSVSHDLRSPVRAMQGYAKALLEDCGRQLDEEGREYVNRIIQGSTRMERLIHDVLTYSRVSRMQITLQPVSLEELVRGVVAQYPELSSDRAEITIRGSLPTVLGHEASLGQAVANLLTNAVKFVPPGLKPQIHIFSELKDGQVTLRFQDNGIGIKPEHQNRLFGMFERIHPEGRYEGTGIGLAIVRKTVERMGGKVGVESDGLNGSTFWIQLAEHPIPPKL